MHDRQDTRAERFLDGLYGALAEVDHNEVWVRSKLKDAGFCSAVFDSLMRSVAHEALGLKRVRLWRTVRPEGSTDRTAIDGFECVYSWTLPEATVRGKPRRDAYKKRTTRADDLYCRYTIGRYRHDPFAKWQHPAMFGEPDPNCRALDKDPDGSWFVAPIVKASSRLSGTENESTADGRLLGFISADAHELAPNDKLKQLSKPTQREIAFQCRALDVLADLAQYVMPRKQESADKVSRNGAGRGD
jgi:hypothetical protein